MSLIVPLTAVIAGACALIWGRTVLQKHKLNFKIYIPLGMALIALFMIPAMPFFYEVNAQMLTSTNLLLLAGLIISAYIYNFFFFMGFSHERLTEVESLMLLIPLFATGFAFIFFPSERALLPIVLGIIASLALLWSHLRKGHLNFSQSSKYIIIAALFIGIEYVFIKQLLLVYNPFTLYFIRITATAILFYFLLMPDISKIEHRSWKYILAAQAASAIQYNFIFWSVKLNGIVITNLILNLLPVTVFAYAYYVYKDHPGRKKIIAALIILACVITAQIHG